MIQTNPSLMLVRHRATIGEIYKSGKAVLRVYDGAIPTSVSVAPTGKLIATLYTRSATAPTATTTSTPIEFDDGLINVDATPTFARLLAGDGTVLLDVSIGSPESAEPLKYSTADFYLGGLLKVTSLIIRES